MTTYQYNTVAGTSINFNPATDQLSLSTAVFFNAEEHRIV